MMRMTRAAIINLLASPYIEMAQLKGIPRRAVIVRHALPNAWAPIVTVIAFNLAYLVVGVVVVEVVFVYPGIGQLMVDAVSRRDMPVVQACALIFAATYILLNLSPTSSRSSPIRDCCIRDDRRTRLRIIAARRPARDVSAQPRRRRSAPGSA